MNMFCFQCEQTNHGTGCTEIGQCFKQPETAVLQDVIVNATKGLAMYAHRARQLGATDQEIDSFTLEALFATLTNVNFDNEVLGGIADHLAQLRDRTRQMYEKACAEAGQEPVQLSGPAAWVPAEDLDEMIKEGAALNISGRRQAVGEDLVSLQEMLTYGLKGMAAYAYHAEVLGMTDPDVYAFFHQALDFLTEEHSVDELVGMNLKTGEVNLKVMALLDMANTEAFGHPVPTPVRITPVKGKAILVSGHDLKDLEELLEQTEDKGINIYTHGEMLPAHGYPKLKAYPHLVGNYGGAWYAQIEEFDAFPGAILMTTNCIQRPERSYQDRIFTAGPVAWPEIKHIEDRDFSPVIEAAQAAEGFTEDAEEQTVMTGFARTAVMGVADKVIEAVKGGAVKHFFLIGGCDGDKPGRNYYTEMAQAVPEDCVISWYEQKAVSILLSLLHLGIKNIRLGPSLPAFVSPAVLNVLVENFNIMPITTVEEDLQAMLS